MVNFYRALFRDAISGWRGATEGISFWVAIALGIALLFNKSVVHRMNAAWDGISPWWGAGGLVLLFLYRLATTNYEQFEDQSVNVKELEGKVAALTALSEDDPHIIVRVNPAKLPFFATEKWIGERPIYIENTGKRTAYKVQVQRLMFFLTQAAADFPEITPLESGRQIPIRPELRFEPREEMSGVSEFEVLLQVEGRAHTGDWSTDYVVPMRITYEDHIGRRFESEMSCGYSCTGGTRIFDFKFKALP